MRATFSAEENTVNISLPNGWQELTGAELEMVYSVMSRYASEDCRFQVLRRLAGLRVTRMPRKGDKIVCKIDAEDSGKVRAFRFLLSGEDFAGWIEDLNWILEPGFVPVRLDSLHGRRAINAKLMGVPFESYLMIENYYQGFLASQNDAALLGMARILYPGDALESLTGAEKLNILNWVAQLKNLFARSFRHLFQPAGASDGPVDMAEIMNNELRALTGGDVTKETEVRSVDCWRALTELDYKAKEAEEIRRERAKHKR